MEYSLEGAWQNEFGSIMELKQVSNDGVMIGYEGRYTSHTGETGIYKVAALADANPTANGQTVSITVFWKNLAQGAQPTPYDHAISSFAGQLQLISGNETITTLYMLVSNTSSSEDWSDTSIDKSVFHRIVPLLPPVKTYATTQSKHIRLPLQLGATTDNGATPWYAQIDIGKPAQALKLMIDTGTPHTWVFSTLCETDACKRHRRFDPTASSTFTPADLPSQTINFGPWGEMQAQLGNDQFHLSIDGGTQTIAESMRFYLVENCAGKKFAELSCDGGLSIPSVLPVGIDSAEILPSLRNELSIGWPLAAFNFYESDGYGEVLLGAVDTSQFNANSLNILPLIDAGSLMNDGLSYLWTVNLDQLAIGDGGDAQTLYANMIFALDTGSTFFKANQTIINNIVDAITDNGRLPARVSQGLPEFARYPNLTVTLQGQNYVLAPERYFMKLEDGSWRLGFDALDGLPDGFLLAGSVFLNNYYSIFYYQTNSCHQKAVGLAHKI